MNLLVKLALLSCAVLLAACSSPSPAPVLLTLPASIVTGDSSPAAAAPAPAAGASSPLLVLRRVALPEYLVARRVRYRADVATLAEWPNTYWAERIEIGVSREFDSALRSRLPGWTFCQSGCGDQPATLSLQVDILTLDYLRSTRSLQSRTRLTLSDGASPPRVLRVVEATHEIGADADTAQAQASAIAVLIGRLAQAAAPMVQAVRP